MLKRAIAALKYQHQPQIARPLGQWLGACWIQARPVNSSPVVVPIPLHAQKQQERGYNQAILLAESFCAVTGLPLRSRGLQRIRQTQAQYELSATAREQNLAQAFTIGPDFQKRPPTRPVLLLDDIYTTGATGRSAAITLLQEGIQVEGLVAVASANRTQDYS